MNERSVIDLTAKPPVLLRVSVAAAALTAEHVETSEPVDYEFSMKCDAHYLALHDLTFEDGMMRVDGEGRYRAQDLSGTLTFVPAGASAEGWCKPAKRPQAFTALYFDPSAIPEAIASSNCWDRPAVYFRSEELAQTLTKIARLLRHALPFREFLTDMLGQVAVAEFAVHNASAGSIPVERGLESADLQRLREFLRTNIARDIRLDEMASIVGLSKFHFIRSFRAATNRTPYRSLLELRTELAVAEMKAGRSLHEAALAAGFESTAQMSRTMRSILGVSARQLLRRLE